MKKKHLIGAGFHFRGSVNYHLGGIWQVTGRLGDGEIAESSTSCREQEVLVVLGVACAYMILNTHPHSDILTPTRPYLLHQSHTF